MTEDEKMVFQNVKMTLEVLRDYRDKVTLARAYEMAQVDYVLAQVIQVLEEEKVSHDAGAK